MTEAMIDLFDGKHLSEMEISATGWLHAGRLTDLDTGESWRFVYRSTILDTASPEHRQAMEWLDGAESIGEVRLADDPDMMFGTGEMTLWEP